MTDLAGPVLNHFSNAFGAPRQSRIFPRTVPDQPALHVYHWFRPNHAIHAFCSVGYAAVPLPQAGAAHRLEFYLPSRRIDFDEAAHLILTCASSPLNDGLDLDFGHTIGLREPASRHSQMRRLFITEPWEDPAFCTIALPMGLHARVLMALPIFEAELAFIRKEGEEAFWSAVEHGGADLIDYSRAPLPAAKGYGLQEAPHCPQ